MIFLADILGLGIRKGKCARCGKEFTLYEEHVYKDVVNKEQRLFCSFSCFRKRDLPENRRKRTIPREQEPLEGEQGTRYESPYVECPFYKYERYFMIVCEGVAKGSTLQLSFSGKGKKSDYRMRVCERNYKDCPIACMLEKKWEEK